MFSEYMRTLGINILWVIAKQPCNLDFSKGKIGHEHGVFFILRLISRNTETSWSEAHSVDGIYCLPVSSAENGHWDSRDCRFRLQYVRSLRA